MDHRLRAMTTLIVNITAERFGTEASKPAPSKPQSKENPVPQGRTQAAKEAIQVSGGSQESWPSEPESNPKETTLDLTEGRVPQMEAEGESQEEGSILGQPIQVDQTAPWPKEGWPPHLLQGGHKRSPQGHL